MERADLQRKLNNSEEERIRIEAKCVELSLR